MEHPPHRLDPLQAWNTARSVAADSVSIVEEARDTSAPTSNRIFDPTVFDRRYQDLKDKHQVWPYASAVQLHMIVYTGEEETPSHDELVSYVGEWIMDRFKQSPAFTLTTDTDVDKELEQDRDTTDDTTSPNPSLSDNTLDTDPLTELAHELVTTSEHPDATYTEVNIEHDELPPLRPAILRMEVVNRATEDRDQHITNVRAWLTELIETDTPPMQVQRQPMGVAPTTD